MQPVKANHELVSAYNPGGHSIPNSTQAFKWVNKVALARADVSRQEV